MSERRKPYSFARIILRIIPMVVKATPLHCLFTNLMGVVLSAMLVGKLIATQGLFDGITDAAVGQAEFMDCLILLIALAGVTFGEQIVNGITNFQVIILFEKAGGKIKTLLHQKIQRIDPVNYEKTNFLDDLNKAREGAKIIPYFVMNMSLMVSVYFVYFASVGAYLYQLKPMLLFTLLLSFIPALFAQVVRGKVFTSLEEQSAPLRRENEYYQKTMCDREYYKETRILGAYKFFYQLFEDTLKRMTHKQWKAERKTALLQLLFNTTTFVGMAVGAYMLFVATMSGEITVGAFAAVFGALNMIFGLMQEIITEHIGNMNRDIGKIANFIRMLDEAELNGEEEKPDFTRGIIAEGISFTYPEQSTPVIKDISLTITAGETVAVVGENGAGKSTLVRLLTGIYRPSAGQVMVGGQDTAATAPTFIYEGISGVFQKYQRYKMTLKENVAISDTKKDSDATRISMVLEKAGGKLESISQDTMLSPEFDGIDLSGGQWQRLSIARGLYRPHDFIVLDEPTAAIDPLEEMRIYTQFKRLAEGKCAIIVTHRLGSARLAHRIIVMEDGRIADMGTHDELISRPGKYAEMWAAQANWYERSDYARLAE